MTETKPVSPCISCQRPYGRYGYFEVVRVDGQGVNRGSVRVCSLKCLVSWAYTEGTGRVVAGVQNAKGALDGLLAMFKGPPRVK